jgi:hypothetical protein
MRKVNEAAFVDSQRCLNSRSCSDDMIHVLSVAVGWAKRNVPTIHRSAWARFKKSGGQQRLLYCKTWNFHGGTFMADGLYRHDLSPRER